jgi:phage-related holin
VRRGDKKLSSEVGFKGICRKVLIFLLVGIANALDVQVIGHRGASHGGHLFLHLQRGSVPVENSAHLGLPVPEKAEGSPGAAPRPRRNDTKEGK